MSDQSVKPNMLLLLALLLLSYGAGSVRCSTVHVNITDIRSLLRFKKSTNDPTDALRNWNRSIHYCNWNGVKCSSLHPGRIVALDLPGQSLSGQVNPSIGNITFLKRLNLSSNGFSGQLPPLNQIRELISLDLSSNSFQGIIPDSLTKFSNLQLLNLSFNALSGQLPPLDQFHELLQLDLSSNSFQGLFPDSFTNSSNLKLLNLANNSFSGQLPPLNQFHELVKLDLSSNSFQGIISDSFTNRSNLKFLNLANNGFSGQLPRLNQFHELISLDLSSNSFQGIIPDSLTNFSELQLLNLSFNALSGQLPPLNQLPQLVVLALRFNLFQGIIPDSLTNCSNLKGIDLSRNMLEGPIPAKIGSLYNLIGLDLSFNNLTGVIPPNISNATKLQRLLLQGNKLGGSIPDELGQLSNMTGFVVGVNRLSGQIPPSIFNLTSLQFLGLYENRLQMAALPLDIGDRLPNLLSFTLGKNMLEGPIPESLGNILGLQVIDLASNSFTGEIPSFGKLLNLQYLNLADNKLESSDNQRWESLYGLTNCRLLKSLRFKNNQLKGAIPNSVGKLAPQLEILHLGGNNLSGIVPLSIGNLDGLIELDLSTNSFNGSIEGWVESLKNLQSLDLHGNNFVGTIPPSFGNLTRLTLLYLANNEFQGPIPPIFGKLTGLSAIDLSYNNLQGDIPPEISGLTQLRTLNLSSNRLTGEIPDDLSQCQGLVTIQMDHNNLTGNIPATFGELTSLNMLNLSYNDLSGAIPGSLQLVGKLDLSHNHLQGEIPIKGVFSNASAVSLDGNSELCGGVPELHMPPCLVASHRGTKIRYYLIRVLIPLFGFMSLLLLIYFLVLERKMRRTRYESQAPLGEHFPKVSYSDLVEATKNFSESNLLGKGSYGTVYRGKLVQHKLEVAVKVFNLEMQGAERSFLSECEALRSVQHRNLVSIITACSTVDSDGSAFRALIYEFMPKGNLDAWLHHKGDGKADKHLTLTQRIGIAVNMADALDYLHNDSENPIIHCDLKPSNILLDDDMVAHLGDFGIARIFLDSGIRSASSTSSIGVRGTIGYIPPEYGGGGRISTSGDVYSFGIVLLEMLTGKRPTDPMFTDGLDIVNFVGSEFPYKIHEVIDNYLKGECEDSADARIVSEDSVHQCLESLLQVALSCTHSIPSERANMRDAASKIQAIQASYLARQR
ncbi:LRR receptor-like kinase [Hordeum vulgare]|nr:LRR receptor-like kinase [Hordeum vulgare]